MWHQRTQSVSNWEDATYHAPGIYSQHRMVHTNDAEEWVSSMAKNLTLPDESDFKEKLLTFQNHMINPQKANNYLLGKTGQCWWSSSVFWYAIQLVLITGAILS